MATSDVPWVGVIARKMGPVRRVSTLRGADIRSAPHDTSLERCCRHGEAFSKALSAPMGRRNHITESSNQFSTRISVSHFRRRRIGCATGRFRRRGVGPNDRSQCLLCTTPCWPNLPQQDIPVRGYLHMAYKQRWAESRCEGDVGTPSFRHSTKRRHFLAVGAAMVSQFIPSEPRSRTAFARKTRGTSKDMDRYTPGWQWASGGHGRRHKAWIRCWCPPTLRFQQLLARWFPVHGSCSSCQSLNAYPS
jgi:hypothetical protein